MMLAVSVHVLSFRGQWALLAMIVRGLVSWLALPLLDKLVEMAELGAPPCTLQL